MGNLSIRAFIPIRTASIIDTNTGGQSPRGESAWNVFASVGFVSIKTPLIYSKGEAAGNASVRRVSRSGEAVVCGGIRRADVEMVRMFIFWFLF